LHVGGDELLDAFPLVFSLPVFKLITLELLLNKGSKKNVELQFRQHDQCKAQTIEESFPPKQNRKNKFTETADRTPETPIHKHLNLLKKHSSSTQH
jgi:hypothetical protein